MSTSFPLQISLAFSEFSQFPAPSFSPKHAPSQPCSLNTMRLLPGELSCSEQWDVEAPVSLGSFRFPLMSSVSKTAIPTLASNALPPSTITMTAGTKQTPTCSSVQITVNDIFKFFIQCGVKSLCVCKHLLYSVIAHGCSQHEIMSMNVNLSVKTLTHSFIQDPALM